MKDSTELISDAKHLAERIEEDGYLLVRRLVEPAQAEEAKREIMAILREHHILEDDDAAEPLWSGGPAPTEANCRAG